MTLLARIVSQIDSTAMHSSNTSAAYIVFVPLYTNRVKLLISKQKRVVVFFTMEQAGTVLLCLWNSLMKTTE